MRYNVVVEGVYQSINFCPITNVQKEKLEDFSERNNVSFGETLFNDSDEILGLEWSELCDEELIKGVIPEESEIIIYDEYDKIVYKRKISEMKSINDILTYEEELSTDLENKLLITHKEKGEFLDDLVDFEERFDGRKIKVILDNFIMNNGIKYVCCYGFEYNGIQFWLNPTNTHYFSFNVEVLS